jgi:hypothetical protein
MANINAPITDPHAALEQVLIDEYLESRGQTRQSVRKLDEVDALPLLRAASDYASLRLAVIESRAHYVDQIHKMT